MSKQISPSEFGRVAVLMGGHSSEREISLQSGAAVLAALQECGIDAFGIDYVNQSLSLLENEKVDRVYIMLHGSQGEDGTMQGALETLGLPYTGSGVLASALAMDKIRTKKIWTYDQLPTPTWVELKKESDFSAVLDELGTVFVKPVCEGSSIGISKASTTQELIASYELASKFDSRVIAETWISGREFSVPVVDGEVMPVIELQTSSEFYDYEAKYLSDQTEYICPAILSSEQTRLIQDISLKAYESISCSGWGRVDVMQDQQGNFWLLEVNTVPGMTTHSLVPMGAKEAGISFNELVVKILETTFLDISEIVTKGFLENSAEGAS